MADVNTQDHPPAGRTFWDDFFADSDYRYGTEPNTWIAEAVAAHCPRTGSAVELACGEGRNAVWLARRGFAVLACDSSHVGLEKTAALARQHNQRVTTHHTDVLQSPPSGSFDLVVSSFFHVAAERTVDLLAVHAQLAGPAALLVAEWFHPDQRHTGKTSGGPHDATMLITPRQIEDFFADRHDWRVIVCRRCERDLAEGTKHRGPAITSQLVAQRAG